MDNKLSELSKPVAYKFDHGVMGPGDFKYGTPQMHSAAKDENASSLYSQEYVSALKHESSVNWEAAASLNVENQELKKRIAELEAKLATPVRLLGEMLVHDWEHSAERQATFQHRKIAWDARLAEDKKAILAAGFTFTVEGDSE